jgi:hypothetical protein
LVEQLREAVADTSGIFLEFNFPLMSQRDLLVYLAEHLGAPQAERPQHTMEESLRRIEHKLRTNFESGKHAVLVVDEAQDLMSYESLDLLEGCVRGGLSDGRWVMFMDQNRQAHLYGDFDPDALQFVRSLGAVPATLRANCRNTREITFQTRALTGADVGVAAAGSGPEVEFVTVEDGQSETALLEGDADSAAEVTAGLTDQWLCGASGSPTISAVSHSASRATPRHTHGRSRC